MSGGLKHKAFFKAAVFFAFVVCLTGYGLFRQAFAERAMLFELDKKLDENISLDLRDMDVVDVYKFLALKGDFNTSISRNISGRVTLYLREVSIRDALDIISLANNLAYKIIGDNIIHVITEAEYQSIFGKKFSDRRVVKILRLNYLKPAYALEALKQIKSDIGKVVIDEETGSVVMLDTRENVRKMEETISSLDHPMDVYVYDLKYANADDVVSKLKQRLDNKAVGSAQADTRSNQVIVRAFPDRLKEVEKIIELLDKKTKAVLIEVRILKIVLKPGFDMGIDWEALFKGATNLALTGAFPVATTVTDIGTLGQIAVGQLDADNFAFNLKLLKEISATKVLANPRLMVTNNEEAKIHIGDKLAYVTTTTITQGEKDTVNEEIHYIDVGLKFIVTPTINDDGFITMKIKPEISSKSGELETPQGALVPLINTTVVETEIIVKDGHTVIIAGLRQEEVSDSQKGIPGFMSVPLIGKLFSNTARKDLKTEIVILLTPHIVSGDENFTDCKARKEIRRPYKQY